jgi:class 3 adenylate cyclase
VPFSDLGFAVTSSSHRVRRTFGFLDLCGFTAYSNTRGDESAVAQLAAFRAIVRSVGSATGVRIAKWLGDGAMLVGLEPPALVSAVLEVSRRMQAELAEPWQVLAPADLIPGLAGTGAVLGAVEVAGWDHPIAVADLAKAMTLVEALNL